MCYAYFSVHNTYQKVRVWNILIEWTYYVKHECINGECLVTLYQESIIEKGVSIILYIKNEPVKYICIL